MKTIGFNLYRFYVSILRFVGAVCKSPVNSPQIAEKSSLIDRKTLDNAA